MNEKKIAILGLGYVGLPLAVNLCKHFEVIGYDISSQRVEDLKKGEDQTLEVTKTQLNISFSKNLKLTSDIKQINNCNIFIATVPTPIDKSNKPDFRPLINVCTKVAKVLKKETL